MNQISCLVVICLVLGVESAVIKQEAEERLTTLTSCLATCAAVNFASTTSCSFSYGFLIQVTYTNTCNNITPAVQALYTVPTITSLTTSITSLTTTITDLITSLTG